MSRISETRSDAIRQTQRSEISQQTQKAQVKQRAETTKTGATGPKDGVDQGKKAAAPTMKSAAQPGTTTTAGGANPFAQLAQRAQGFQMPPRVLAGAVPMDQDVSPDGKTMAKLAGLVKVATGLVDGRGDGVHDAADKIRQGVMLTLSDSVDTHTGKNAKISRSMVSNIAESIIETKNEAAALAAAKNGMFSQKALFGPGMDVQAYVQAVLRESYLLQNEILKDYADRVKHWNETKKAIRAKAKAARAYQRKLKEAMQNDPPGPFPDPIDFDLLLDDDKDFQPTWRPSDGSDPSGSGLGIDGTNETGSGKQVDSDETIDGVPEGQVDLPGSLEGDYAQITPSAKHSEDANAVRQLIHDITKGDDWGDKKQAYYEFFYEKYAGSDKVASARSVIERALSELSPDDLRRLAKMVAWVAEHGVKGNEDSKGYVGANILRSIVEHTSPSKLAAMADAGGSDLVAAIDGETGGKLSSTIQSFRTELNHLQGAWTSDTELAPFATKYAEWLSLPDTDKRKARMLNDLKAGIWKLPADKVHDLLAGIAENNPPGGGDTLFGLLKASDWRKVFADAKPSEWKFLADAGGEAKEFFSEWIGEDAPAPERRDIPGFSNVTQAQQPGNIASMSSASAGLQSSTDPAIDPISDETKTPDDQVPPYPEGMIPTDASLEDYIKDLEEELQTAGDDAQLANVDLQNALQKQQQTLQMMSNISKMLHDTAMSIIRKIGS